MQRGASRSKMPGSECRMQEMWGSVAGRTLQAYWARCTLTNFPPRVEGDCPGPLPGSCTRGKEYVLDPQVNTPNLHAASTGAALR